MEEKAVKIVQSPVVADVELPLPVHYNGLDQPVLDGYVQTGSTLFVRREGDTASGSIAISVSNPQVVVGGVSPVAVSLGLDIAVSLADSFTAIDSIAYGIRTTMENGSSDANQTLIDLQIGPRTES